MNTSYNMNTLKDIRIKNLLEENKKLLKENDKLLQENDKLNKDIEFFYKIYNFPNALVYHMYVKTKNDEKIWVNSQNADINFLKSLDQDDQVKSWIGKFDIKYKDNDF